MRRAAFAIASLFFASGCQYVFGVDFLDDPKLASSRADTPDAAAPGTPPSGQDYRGTCAERNACPGPIGGTTQKPCVPGEPDCTTKNDGTADRGPAGASHETSIAAGNHHVCTIVDGGQVKCFGNNDNGELGDDMTTSSGTAVLVPGLDHVKALAAGSFHTCALLESGSVKCWGTNGSGQLGDGTLETRLLPVAVPALDASVVALAAGSEHTCALLVGGVVKCWGSNAEGQLGNGTTTSSRIPLAVPITATSISAGVSAHHTCASTQSGIKCWGDNRKGQLGNGTTSDSLSPVQVPGLGPGMLTAGIGHTCALTADGVFCWGDNRLQQLGTTKGGTGTNLPIPVDGLAGATRLSCAVNTCCAATQAAGGGQDAVTCWGVAVRATNDDGTPTGSPPAKLDGVPTPLDGLSAGQGFSCARSGPHVTCWGQGPWTPPDAKPPLPPAVIGGF